MEERFTPQMHLDYYTTRRGISVRDIGVAPVAVISWGQKVIQSLAEAVGAQPSPYWLWERYQFYTGAIQGHQVCFAEAPVGAPGTVMMMEGMIALCNLLVVSDELWQEWRPAFGSLELREATELAQRVILRCLEHDFGMDARSSPPIGGGRDAL